MKMRVSIFIFVNIQNSSLYMIYYARVGVFLVKTKGDEVDGKSRVPFLLEKSGFSHVQNQKGEVVVYRNHTLGKISSKSLNSIALNFSVMTAYF